MSPEADILALVVSVGRFPRHMVRRDEQCVEAVLRLDEWGHTREELELFVRHLEFCIALRLIVEKGHGFVDQNGQWVLRIRVKFALRQV